MLVDLCMARSQHPKRKAGGIFPKERGPKWEQWTHPNPEQFLFGYFPLCIFVDGPYILLTSIWANRNEHPIDSPAIRQYQYVTPQNHSTTHLPGLFSISTNFSGISGAAAPTWITSYGAPPSPPSARRPSPATITISPDSSAGPRPSVLRLDIDQDTRDGMWSMPTTKPLPFSVGGLWALAPLSSEVLSLAV